MRRRRPVMLLLCLVLLAFAFALPAIFRLAPRWRASARLSLPVPGSASLILPSVPVRWLVKAIAEGADEPMMVSGMPATPPPEQWGLRWGCTHVRVLLTPDGLVGAYGNNCEPSITMGAAGKLEFSDPQCRKAPQCTPRHTARTMPLDDALLAFAAPASVEPWATHAYVRGTCPADTVEHQARLALEEDHARLRNLSPYLSSTGTTTNLHWDGNPGVLAQTGGSKLVHLYAPGTMPSPVEDRGSPCFRRSLLDGADPPEGAALQLLLREGDAVYIPAFWAHHILSLSPRTLGAVWRFHAHDESPLA